jgi:AcrR family transcriptional regulator
MLAIDSSFTSPLTARERLFEAAVELFATHGFHSISLRDLASHLGIQAGSLYHHIENKECLLFELIESALSDLLVTTKRCISGAKRTSDRVRSFVQVFVSFTSYEKNRLILVNREFVNLSEEHKHHVDQLKKNYQNLLYEIIENKCRVKDGSDERIHLLTNTIIGMLYGQLQWNDVVIKEMCLTELLTGCILRIIDKNKEDVRSASL